jgi:ADP-ribose pyrophosphatase YjhB (NUDIX family)
MDSGESVTEACEREVFEETGLKVRVKRLVGIYSHPDQLIIYPDGNKCHIVAIHLEAEIVGGELGLSDETSAFGYFNIDEVEALEMLGKHMERIVDTLANQNEAFLR